MVILISERVRREEERATLLSDWKGVWEEGRAKILRFSALRQELSFAFSIIIAKLPVGSNLPNSYVFSSKSVEPRFEPRRKCGSRWLKSMKTYCVFIANALSLGLSLGSNAAHAGSNL